MQNLELQQENERLKQENERLRQDNKQLEATIKNLTSELYQLRLKEHGGGVGVEAILKKADEDRQHYEATLKLINYQIALFLAVIGEQSIICERYFKIAPLGVLDGAGVPFQMIEGENVETAKSLNLQVGATVCVRYSYHPDAPIKVWKLDNLIFQGSGSDFEHTVLSQLPMLLSGQPTPADFYRSQPRGMPMEQIGAALHILAGAQLISPDEYKKQRKKLFRDYWELFSSTQQPNDEYTRPEAQRDFYRFFDDTFKNWKRRIQTINTPFETFPKRGNETSPDNL